MSQGSEARRALADKVDGLASKATPRPWNRTPGAEKDEEYLTGPDGEHLRRIDAKLMQVLANNLPVILAALRDPAPEPANAGAEMREIDTGPRLTTVQRRGLAELAAACDESLRFWPSAEGWTRTGLLSGSREERSAVNMQSLMKLGLAEGEKPSECAQAQWRWRITPVGRRALATPERVQGAPGDGV